MTIFLSLQLIMNMTVGITLYIVMYRRRKVFQDRFAMSLSITLSAILSLILSMLLYLLFPIDIAYMSVITIACGAFIGISIGALHKFQTVLSGFFHGTMGAYMGTMLGAVILDPSICGLPYVAQVNQSIMSFSLFGTFLLITTTSLIYYSLKV